MRELLRIPEAPKEDLGSGPRPSGLQAMLLLLCLLLHKWVHVHMQRGAVMGPWLELTLHGTLLEDSSQESSVTTCWVLSVLSPTPTSVNKHHTALNKNATITMCPTAEHGKHSIQGSLPGPVTEPHTALGWQGPWGVRVAPGMAGSTSAVSG